MDLKELIEKVADAGIREIKNANFSNPIRTKGCVDGFKICRTLEPKQFPDILKQRHQAEKEMKINRTKSEDYWLYRHATAQIEYCWEILKVAQRIPPYSARAVHQYERLAGETF